MTSLPPDSKKTIGVDEVGRGPLAGPLVVCAFHHPDPARVAGYGARDSKLTSREERERFFKQVQSDFEAQWTIAVATPEWINQAGTNTSEAQKVMTAVSMLAHRLGIGFDRIRLLGDGDNKSYPNLSSEIESAFVPKADQTEPLVSAASMLAKRVHDQCMDQLIREYPGWDFENHRGYASPKHIQLLYERGLTPAHRVRASEKAVQNYAEKHHLPKPEWLLQSKARS